MEILVFFVLAAWAAHAAQSARHAGTYTDKASPGEMAFAGSGLNAVGIALVVAGLVHAFRAPLAAGLEQGSLPLAAGALLGFLMLATAEAYHRRDAAYAQALAGGGLTLLLLTACAARYHFGLLSSPGLLVALTALVASSGLAAVRYRSRAIGYATMGAVLLAPFVLRLPFEDLGVCAAYLLAVHVGATCVALQRRWDLLHLASFCASYAVFFLHVTDRAPVPTLAFLTAMYVLHAATHAWLQVSRRAGPLPMVLSLAHPAVYAVAACPALMRLPGEAAASVCLALAALHLAVAAAAHRRALPDPCTAHLTAGSLFATGAISFVPFVTTNTAFFGAATTLWLAQALVLLLAAESWAAQAPTLRRLGYFCLALGGLQVAYVVPTVPTEGERAVLDLLCVGTFAATFGVLHRTRVPLDLVDRAAMQAAAWTGTLLAFTSATRLEPAPIALAVLGATASAAVVAATRYRADLPWFAGLGLLGTATSVGASLWRAPLAQPGAFSVDVAAMLALAASLAAAATVARRHPLDVPRAADALSALAVLALLKTALLVDAGPASTLLWGLLGLALLRHVASPPVLVPTAGAPLGLVVLLTAFLKAIILDANFAVLASKGELSLQLAPGGALNAPHALAALALVAVFLAAARQARAHPETRGLYTLLSLVDFAFQSAFALYEVYGVLDAFQGILSAYWLATAGLFVTFGVVRENKPFRLFGLVLLCATVLKVCVVDMGVLGTISQATALWLTGALLMARSLLYQRHRDHLILPGPSPVM